MVMVHTMVPEFVDTQGVSTLHGHAFYAQTLLEELAWAFSGHGTLSRACMGHLWQQRTDQHEKAYTQHQLGGRLVYLSRARYVS